MVQRFSYMTGSLVLAGLIGLSGCGGGSSSTATTPVTSETVTALKVADKVSVVDAASTGSGKLLGLFASGISVGAATSDYNTDKTFTYVHERSAEAFNTVNEILCAIGQTKYDAMINKGPYKALINVKLCKGNDSASNADTSSAGSSAGDAPEYETWTVDVTRANNTSPQIVKVWIHEKARSEGSYTEPEKIIYAKAVVTETSSASNPYGLFSINFVAYPATNGVPTSSTPVFKGLLKTEKDATTGKVILKFADKEANGMFEEAASLEKNSDGTGSGKTYQKESFGGVTNEGTINFAYSSQLFRRLNADSTEVCLDRQNFDTSAWRYGMYDATSGSRVNVSSGFPINTKQDGTGSHGWVGYWGLWLPEGVALSNGATVYKQNYGPNAGAATAYTVLKAGGKLKKHTKFTATLDDIKNIPLQGSDFATQKMYRVIWDGTKLAKVAEATQSQSGPPAWTDLSPAVEYDYTTLQWGELNFWSEALGGQVRIPLANCTMGGQNQTSCSAPTGASNIVYFVENIVYPGDTVPATLACFDNCPSITSGIVSGQQQQQQTATNYTFNTATDMVLKTEGGAALVQTATGGESWGFNSGPLFDAALIADPATSPLKCDWQGPQGPMICGWKAWSVLDVFYTWETGLNNWNQLSALKDPTTGAPLKFEQPLRVEYVHAQTNTGKPDYKYNGTKFFLDYNGFGELHGIPGKCVDQNGVPVPGNDCSGDGGKRWVPEFTIPEGSAASYTKGSTTYQTRIKPLEMEQRMTKLANSACSALTITPSAHTLPVISNGTIEGWVDPALGTEPTVTAAPAVIGGVVQ